MTLLMGKRERKMVQGGLKLTCFARYFKERAAIYEMHDGGVYLVIYPEKQEVNPSTIVGARDQWTGEIERGILHFPRSLIRVNPWLHNPLMMLGVDDHLEVWEKEVYQAWYERMRKEMEGNYHTIMCEKTRKEVEAYGGMMAGQGVEV